MNTAVPPFDELRSKQQWWSRRLAVLCLALALTLMLAALPSGFILGMPMRMAWRLPFTLLGSIGLAALATAGWRNGYVLGSNTVIERRTRPYAYWSLISVTTLFAIILLSVTVALLWLTYGQRLVG